MLYLGRDGTIGVGAGWLVPHYCYLPSNFKVLLSQIIISILQTVKLTIVWCVVYPDLC